MSKADKRADKITGAVADSVFDDDDDDQVIIQIGPLVNNNTIIMFL